mmetsp:Transcript_18872/g.25964  ORF Transcript_18872/g.25964 Transcript_18872/m.25964 type:complete len:96 (-) Transcript_18872:10-297(-)
MGKSNSSVMFLLEDHCVANYRHQKSGIIMLLIHSSWQDLFSLYSVDLHHNFVFRLVFLHKFEGTYRGPFNFPELSCKLNQSNIFFCRECLSCSKT